MSDAGPSSETLTTEPASESSPLRDIVLLVVLLLIAGTLIRVGAGMLVAMLLGFILIISMLTLHAVFEERGEKDPAVKRARKSMALAGLLFLPVPVMWLLGAPPLYVLIPLAGLLVLVCWRWCTAKDRMTLRVFLRGPAEKHPGYLDLQITRNIVFVLIACAIFTFDPSRVGTTLRDLPITRRPAAATVDLAAAREMQEKLEELSTAMNQLLESTAKRAVDAYMDSPLEQKLAFLDKFAADDDDRSPHARVFLLSRILEKENDPALQTRIVTIINADTDLQLPLPPERGYLDPARASVLGSVERWIARQ